MPPWVELVQKIAHLNRGATHDYLHRELHSSLEKISHLQSGKDVIFYASGWIQNPGTQGTSISDEDIQGFQVNLHKLKCDKGLVLLLHTPGGSTNAVESIVEYLHKKFDDTEITAVIPYLAMSGGSMISLASDCVVMSKHSYIGPIDPQMIVNGKYESAREIVNTFNKAKTGIKDDPNEISLWAPFLESMSPALFTQAESALKHSELLASKWLKKRMFRELSDGKTRAERVAKYFNAEDDEVNLHSQRIDIDTLRELGVTTQLLEDDQNLQEEVLTAHHLMTLIFQTSNDLRFITNSQKSKWIVRGRVKANA